LTLTEEERWWLERIKRLSAFRWHHPELMAAPLTQSIPQDGWYWMEHRAATEAVTVYVNRSSEPRQVKGERPGFDVIEGVGVDAEWDVAPGSCRVIYTSF
jgi:hypothetical protein